VIPDHMFLVEARVAAMRDLPWPIPALVVIRMRDADLDRLEAATETTHYWRTLNEIVRRITEEKGEP
jgi:hypothetical protein